MLVGEFADWMGAHGYSPRTIENRQRMLAHLIVWLDERGVTRPTEVTRPMLERYQRWLFHYRKRDGEPLSFRSQSQRLLPVRAFFKWAARQHHVLHNPASEIELPKVERRLPKPALTASEAELVLATPDLSTAAGVRDRTMLEVLYSTGIRRGELANLAVFDVDVDRRTLLVRQGKGRKDRLVPIGERALAWIDRYLHEVRVQWAREPDDGTLFVTVDGTRFSLDRLTQLARDYVVASGVAKQGACHLFRHTLATLMLEGGADIRYVQQMLGHADISTTQIYTQVSIRHLQAIHAATHPAASNVSRPRRVHPVLQSHDDPDERSVSMSELLASLDSEINQENRPPEVEPPARRTIIR
jgi:integrase/recombinase XerD